MYDALLIACPNVSASFLLLVHMHVYFLNDNFSEHPLWHYPQYSKVS